MINPKGLPRSMEVRMIKSLNNLFSSKVRNVRRDCGALSIISSVIPESIDPCVMIFCSDHGIAIEDVTTLSKDFASRTYTEFSRGIGLPFELGRCFDIKVMAIDSSLGTPTKHIAYTNAMTTREYLRCLRIGWEAAVSSQCNLIGIGEIGAGGTTSATALASILLDIDPEKLLGYGSGINERQMKKKDMLIRLAIARSSHAKDVVTLLTQIGGKEMVSMVGAILGAFSRGKIVVLDGFITCVAALIAEKLCPGVSSYLLCYTRTNEPGQLIIASQIGLNPFIYTGHTCGMGFGCFFSIQFCRGAACLSQSC